MAEQTTAMARAQFLDRSKWQRTQAGNLRRSLIDRSTILIEAGGRYDFRFRSGQPQKGVAKDEAAAMEICWTMWRDATLSLAITTELLEPVYGRGTC